MFSVEGFRTTTVYFEMYDLGKAVSSEQSHGFKHMNACP
jgi:hypothetical protein